MADATAAACGLPSVELFPCHLVDSDKTSAVGVAVDVCNILLVVTENNKRMSL